MIRKTKEWLSIQLAKNPGRFVLFSILVFNIVFFFLAALVISNLALTGTEKMGMFEAAFYTITMILDAGCISFVVADIGQTGRFVAIVCLLIVLIGMITFTGAVIGYVTNFISDFIAKNDAGVKRLQISDHFVILNWNSRASEIVNDLLYNRGKQRVLILVGSGSSDIRKEIDERITDSLRRENRALRESLQDLPFIKRHLRYHREKMKNNLDVILREGDVFSSKQLHDISLEQARAVVILGEDINKLRNTADRNALQENASAENQGNAQTIKTLMQVSDITAADYSADNQKIIVEITDDWTWELVDRIIQYKQVSGKCNIVPVRVNQILGQILSQFSLMPELNLVYRELFSNKGITFYVKETKETNEIRFVSEYLKDHFHAIPLTVRSSDGGYYAYYSAESMKDTERKDAPAAFPAPALLNKNYQMERKNVIVLGHNSKCRDLMEGFRAFCNEWDEEQHGDVLKIVVIDDEDHLMKMDHYQDYPFIIKTVAATIFDKDVICSTISDFVDANEGDTSILILSDDEARSDDIDANALANLVYVQDIMASKKKADPGFDMGRMDVIVEIIDPKHHDIVSSYSVDNVVISNRFISKMITQIGEKDAMVDFYADILTYDLGAPGEESKEIYVKNVSDFFEEIPGKATAAELIRRVWAASVDEEMLALVNNPTLVLGYVDRNGRVTLFGGSQMNIPVELGPQDKVIVFANH